MKEVFGDIWNYYDKGHWIVITTNGSVRRDGCCVMGRGIAYQASRRCIGIQEILGKKITQSGNHVYPLMKWRIFSFPVKHRWMEQADIKLIKTSTKELSNIVRTMIQNKFVKENELDQIYMVRPGCGNGLLSWTVVKPVIRKLLDDRFVVIERNLQ